MDDIFMKQAKRFFKYTFYEKILLLRKKGIPLSNHYIGYGIDFRQRHEKAKLQYQKTGLKLWYRWYHGCKLAAYSLFGKGNWSNNQRKYKGLQTMRWVQLRKLEKLNKKKHIQ